MIILMVAVFGDKGRHARTTIGVAALPADASLPAEAFTPAQSISVAEVRLAFSQPIVMGRSRVLGRCPRLR